MLFGLICLETAFPAVFRLLLSVLPHERDFALLLQEGLRAREEVLSLDEDFSLFPKGSDREDRSQRLIDFVDCLADILLKGDRNTRLDKEKIHLLSDLLRLVVATGPSAADWPEDDSRSLALTEFCRRVIDRVEGLLGKGAPDVFDRRIRMQSSGNAWCALRYSADNIKAAWGPGRLFYELSFSPENVASVRLKCDTARAMELGVLPHAIEGLNDLPLVRQGRFHFKDYGNGLVEISTAVQECSCRSVSELVADEVERVAVALQDLVAATSDLFDLPQQGLTPGPPQSAEPPQVLCKICNTPLERMLLKDGSQAYKCTTCSKIFKPKPAAKPAT